MTARYFGVSVVVVVLMAFVVHRSRAGEHGPAHNSGGTDAEITTHLMNELTVGLRDQHLDGGCSKVSRCLVVDAVDFGKWSSNIGSKSKTNLWRIS
jgi:hypothetical protein